MAGSFIARLFQHFECKLSLETSSVIRTEFNTSLAMLQYDAFFITSADLHGSEEVLQRASEVCDGISICPGINMKWAWKSLDCTVYSKDGTKPLCDLVVPASFSPAPVDGTSGTCSGEPPGSGVCIDEPLGVSSGAGSSYEGSSATMGLQPLWASEDDVDNAAAAAATGRAPTSGNAAPTNSSRGKAPVGNTRLTTVEGSQVSCTYMLAQAPDRTIVNDSWQCSVYLCVWRAFAQMLLHLCNAGSDVQPLAIIASAYRCAARGGRPVRCQVVPLLW